MKQVSWSHGTTFNVSNVSPFLAEQCVSDMEPFRIFLFPFFWFIRSSLLQLISVFSISFEKLVDERTTYTNNDMRHSVFFLFVESSIYYSIFGSSAWLLVCCWWFRVFFSRYFTFGCYAHGFFFALLFFLLLYFKHFFQYYYFFSLWL